MIARILYTIGGLIEVLLGLRILFRLLGANPTNGIVEFVYNSSTPFVLPFAGILGSEARIAGTGFVTTSVIDWSAIIALIVVAVIVGLIGQAVHPRRA
jgi:YggT family protein